MVPDVGRRPEFLFIRMLEFPDGIASDFPNRERSKRARRKRLLRSSLRSRGSRELELGHSCTVWAPLMGWL